MSVLGTIGRIASIAGPLIAAPFTGGASLLGMSAAHAGMLGAGLGTLGQVAGGIASGRAGGRLAEQDANSQHDLARLMAARMALEAPGQRAHNAVQGDILAHAQPASVQGPVTHTHGNVPHITGGLSPALFSDSTRQLGGQMSRDALLSQMQPPFAPTPQPQKSGFDTFLNTVGGIGLAGSGLASMFPQGSAPTQHPQLAGMNPQLPYQPLPKGQFPLPMFGQPAVSPFGRLA